MENQTTPTNSFNMSITLQEDAGIPDWMVADAELAQRFHDDAVKRNK